MRPTTGDDPHPGTPAAGARTTTGVAAIGDLVEVGGFGLVGVVVHQARTADEVRAAWDDLPPGIDMVILDAAAAGHLADRETSTRLTVVMPR
ncbi:hypothetical protein [Nocardioides sp.]|uniref:hypothetical protein n=1 Tax=Nocardioides sp. TaxID=35761 RepID=UPI003565C06C